MTDTVHPLVTINIPTYNQKKYIARAIESALAQDYPNIEIVVSDDCSTDGTYLIATKFEGEKVNVYRTPKNLGRVGNYRYMLYTLSKGKWVVNLDGDDYYIDNSFISEAVALLNQHPSCVMYAGAACSQNEQTGLIRQSPIFLKNEITILKGTDYVLNFYKYGQIGQHFAVLYNRELALKTDFYILNSLGADTDSICRLALRGDVLVHKKWIGVWTSHQFNASYTLGMSNVERELNMLDHIGDAARNYLPAPVVEVWLNETKNLKYKQALYSSLPSFSFGKALQLLIKNWSGKLQDYKELAKIFVRLVIK